MMYPIAITMSEAFPIDSNSERNPWGFCRAVSDQRSEISFDKFDMSLSEFEPLPLPPDYRINVQSAPVYENQSNVASLESARLSPPVMQVASDIDALRRRRDILMREWRTLNGDLGNDRSSIDTADANFQMFRPTKRARTITDSSVDRPMQEPTPVTSKRAVPIAMTCDAEYLSEYQCLIRQQIEIFEASEEDVKSRDRGRNTGIYVGQVGIRCKHCASAPIIYHSRGSSYFTSTMNGLYQTAQKMAVNHLSSNCMLIPESVKNSIRELKNDRRRGATGGKRYWAEGARILGVRETKNGGGLHFEKQQPHRHEVPEQAQSAQV